MGEILIKGMEMPRSCFECGLRNGIACFAGKGVLKVDFDSLGGALRHRDCPLVEVKRVESIDDVMEGICYVEVANGRNTD